VTDTSSIDKLTPKQHAFVEAYLETGSGAASYRRVYSCANMAEATVQREATRLLANPKVNHLITTLRARAAEKASLSRAWVLERLMHNATVALGEKTIKLKIRKRNKETGEVSVAEVEITDRDAHAANRALELLGKTDEVRAFVERVEATGKNGEPLAANASSRDVARAVLDILREAHIEGAPEPAADDAEGESEIEDNEIDEVASPCASSNAGADLSPAQAAGVGFVAPAAAPSPAEPPRPRVRTFNPETGRLE
jgi:phage terminase small subunit